MLSIRTQDRMALVPYKEPIVIKENILNEIVIQFIREKEKPEIAYDLVVSHQTHFLPLGRYATKERALEVLDEIEDMMGYTDNVKYQMPSE